MWHAIDNTGMVSHVQSKNCFVIVFGPSFSASISELLLKERGLWTPANKHSGQKTISQEQRHSFQKGCVYCFANLLNVSAPSSEETTANVRTTQNRPQYLSKAATDVTE